MTKTVLLTGVSGFIAKRIALDLLNAGHSVRGSLRSMSRADEVASRSAATYLDLTFAHLARAAVHRRRNRLGACEDAIAMARQTVAGTDDVVMPLIIAMAEAVCGLGSIHHTEVRFRGLGLDPEGWRHAWSLAAAVDTVPA